MKQFLHDDEALKVILTALQSGTIKLLGGHSAEGTARNNARTDALYLLTLFQKLQNQPPADPQ